MVRTDRLVLDTVTGPATLDDIQDSLMSLWAMNPEVPELIRCRVAIAAAEVGANIIEHAGLGVPVRMRMESAVRAHSVRVTFTDEGVAAEVDLTRLTMPAELAERGRGLALARAVLAEFGYRRNGVVNEWTLVSDRFC